jgi:calcineurin-like phosphoesterase family protein
MNLKKVVKRNSHLYNLMEFSIWDQDDKERLRVLEANGEQYTMITKHDKSLKNEQY